MSHSIFTLDPNYSTTRLVSTINPLIEDHPKAKFKTQLFLPEDADRQGEGGLRTKGYFKHSFEVIDGQWYITDNFGVSEKEAQRIPVDQEQVPNDFLEYVDKSTYTQNNVRCSKVTDKIKNISLPLVSIITVVFNGEKYIEETIKNVLRQGYPNVEYIVIDGCSTDKTLSLIKKYDKEIDYWLSEKDSGIYNAMNKGIQASMGCIVNLLNSGDYFYNDNIISNVALLDTRCNFDVLYGDICYLNKNNKILSYKISKINKLYYRMSIYHPSVFIKNYIYKQIIYNDFYRIAADYDLLLRIRKMNKNFFYINKVVSCMKSGGESDVNYECGQREQKLIRKKNMSLFGFFISEILYHLSLVYCFLKRS